MLINKEKVEMLLANKELMVSDLSKLSGVSRTSLSLSILGQRKARPITIGKIAKALNVPIEEIIIKE